MGLDDEDTPLGAIIGLTVITIIAVVIIIITFDSCTDFERDDLYKYCADVRFEVQGILGQQGPCYDDRGNLRFAFINTGELDLEGVKVNFNSLEVNYSRFSQRLSQIDVSVDLNLRAGIEFSYINVTPITFYPKENKTVPCSRMAQVISRLGPCAGVKSTDLD